MPYTVLIIDDDKTIRELVKDILEPFGFRVRTAGTSEEAILSTFEVAPNVILCDLILPDGLGSELARQLKQRNETKDVPVIFVTGYPYLETVLPNFKATLVTKPFSMTKMIELVHRALEIDVQTPQPRPATS